MAFLQQAAPPERSACRDLQDDRAPRRRRALQVAMLASALGWLMFAAVQSASSSKQRTPSPQVVSKSAAQPVVLAAQQSGRGGR